MDLPCYIYIFLHLHVCICVGMGHKYERDGGLGVKGVGRRKEMGKCLIIFQNCNKTTLGLHRLLVFLTEQSFFAFFVL